MAAICAMPARRFADLLDVPGITEAHVSALMAAVTVLPEATPSTPTRRRLPDRRRVSRATRETLDRAIARRAQQPFASAGDLPPPSGSRCRTVCSVPTPNTLPWTRRSGSSARRIAYSCRLPVRPTLARS